MPLQTSQFLSLKSRKPKVLPEPKQFQHCEPPIRGSPGRRTSGAGGAVRVQLVDGARLICIGR